MGRELRRVPLDFDAPMDETWKGYHNPYTPRRCEACGGTGYNPETRRLSDDWYDPLETGRRWRDRLTQDEVDALADGGRLRDLTHRWIKGKGWVPTGYRPDAQRINERERQWHIHDTINKWICVEIRAKRLGIFGWCETCGGNGLLWASPEEKERYEQWEPYAPPSGDGYQLWSTKTHGPISPVFATAEALADWCETSATVFNFMPMSKNEWLSFFNRFGTAFDDAQSVTREDL